MTKNHLQADYQLDPAGRVLSLVSNSGARTQMQYDANGWVTKLTQYDAANNLVSDTSYTRDRVGNILTQSNTAGANTGTTTYTYDALYRLRTADYPAIGAGSATANDEAFTYDKVGNRKTHTKGSITLGAAGSTTRYYGHLVNTNRLAEVRIGSTTGTIDSSFSYDFEGRLTAQTGTGAKTLTWDAKNRLKTLTQASTTQTYGYDPMDYRIRHSNTTNGQMDYYLEGEHLESVEQNGQLTEKYFRGTSTDELIAAYLKDTDGKSKPYQFHHDNVTSTTQVTGHNGGTLQSITYSAFGNTLNQTGASPNRLKYTGREDDQTGLYYYRARYYDTNIGRFVSEDPLGFEAGINFYAYVDNNPVNANDPTGMVAETPWDLFNVGLGAASLGYNISQKNWGWAAVDAVGLAYDSVATAIPFLPGGASAGLKALQAGNSVKNSINIGIDFAQAAKVSNMVAKDANLVGSAARTGTSIHREVGTILSQNNMLSSSATNAFKGSNGAKGIQADLSWSGSGLWSDLTTAGQWGSHVNKYTSTFGEGIPLIYQVGGGITNLDKLTSGASFGASALQFGSMNFLGSANGGFLLYPNKSNNNQMQSVYSK